MPAETTITVRRQDFLAVMSGIATSVAVVTTNGPAGCFGVTVSAFASVSADPPTILVCINRRSPVVDAIAVNGSLTLNVLAAGQARIAEVFAGRAADHPAFDFRCADWSDRGVCGAHHLCDAAVSLHAVVTGRHAVGTHAILLGEVTAAFRSEADPLIYVRQQFGRPMLPDSNWLAADIGYRG